ncbi:MAG: DSD1 family PLP-dependent enzyme [Candidatus Latescibacteria bacterium]|nr:DSD1 family PLP-dependent enzyme [Candidatus Latescibacterota bacterium]
MIDSAELLGRSIDQIPTPALLVDLEVFESNLRRLAAFCQAHQVAWRPHTKAHKSPHIARLQLEAGACGITCAKLSEAELMAEHGIGDILIANQIVTPAKLLRLAQLQRRAKVMVAVDNIQAVPLLRDAAQRAHARIPLLIEVDIGMKRCGVQPGLEALELARSICQAPELILRGLMGYEGHVLTLRPPEAKSAACAQALNLLITTRDLLLSHGLPVETISAGGTGSYQLTATHPGITEIQAGGGIFMDAMYRQVFSVTDLDYALTILTTVTSRQSTHVVVDAGFKTMSAFHHPPQVLGREDLKLRYLSAEHGVFEIEAGPGPQIGELVQFVAGYSDSTTFLHDFFLGMRQGKVEQVWEILGRGKLY